MTLSRRAMYRASLAALLLAPAALRAQDPADALRLDQIQVIGTHNSYHAGLSPQARAALERLAPKTAQALDYSHPPLATQLDEGARQIELDVFADDEGGRFARPHLPDAAHTPLPQSAAERAAMARPGFKVMHVADLDQDSVCQPLSACLRQIRAWSASHPAHVPIFVLLEVKQKADMPGGTPVARFTAKDFDALDAAIRSVFPPGRLLTPDEVRGDFPTLRQAVETRGWPTLGESRGKVIFLLDQRGDRALYLAGHPGLRGRAAFTNADPEGDDAAFTELNDGPTERIGALARRHMIVRTRADADTAEARTGDTQRRDSALASSAQIVSTDYPDGEPARWSGYHVGFPGDRPGGLPARCDPLTAPQGCVSRVIEPVFPGTPLLRRVVLVMRHGIRSPVAGQEPQGVSIRGGSPQWEVPPGDLTPRGAQGVAESGRFARLRLGEAGLLPESGCPAPGAVAVLSNSMQRTIASGEAFAAGLAPGCGLRVGHRPQGETDPLFSPVAAEPGQFDLVRIAASLPDANAAFRERAVSLALLKSLVHCGGESCAFLDAPSTVTVDPAAHRLALNGPIRDSAAIAEVLTLAYLDGKPVPALAPGDAAGEISRLSALHGGMLDVVNRAPPVALPLSRKLRAKLADELDATSGPVLTAWLGHDETIAWLLGVLDLHFSAPGYGQGEIPVGSALGFAVYEGARGGAPQVRIFFQAQRPQALRADPATATPVLLYPPVDQCRLKAGLCPLSWLLERLRAD